MITRRSLDQFAKLKPPASLESKHKAVLDAETAALDRIQQLADSLQGSTGDVAKVQKAGPDIQRITQTVDAKARAAGLAKCASG